MNAQTQTNRSWTVPAGRAQRMARGDGVLTVLEGRVWVTGRGDCEDHVIGAGERLQMRAAEQVVVEPWDRGQGAVLQWQPRGRAAQGLRWRDLAGAAWAALARSAASSANRAQGCISTGDSMASSGALK